MKLIKQLESHRNLSIAKTVTYKNVLFTQGFQHFCEALSRAKLIPVDVTRTVVESNHRWVDHVAEGGILLETSQHPFVNKNYAGDLTVIGSKDKLELVDQIMRLHEVEYEGATKPEDVTITHQYHDQLNPKFWDGNTLKPVIAKTLKQNAEEFKKYLKIPNLEIDDVTITGSCANYNWTEQSDVDLHLVVDMSRLEEEHGDLVKEYVEAKKKVWNDLHDIKLHGHDAEFYVQDKNEPHHSTGIYSLSSDRWIVEPQHKEPDIDDAAVKAKAARLMNEIDEVTSGCNKAAEVERLMEKIKKMRQAGVAEAGEFSTENLVFKVLRYNGYLEKLATCKTRAFDRTLSIEDEEWNWD